MSNPTEREKKLGAAVADLIAVLLNMGVVPTNPTHPARIAIGKALDTLAKGG